MTVDETNVYLVDAENKVIALDRSNGYVLWTAEPGGNVDSPIIHIGQSLIVITKTPSNGYVRAISKATGITQWVSALQGTERNSLVAFNESVVVIDEGKSLSALNVVEGSTKWRRDVGSYDRHGSVPESRPILTLIGPKRLEILSVKDGRVLEETEHSAISTVFATNDDGAIVTADSRGNIASRGSGSGREWTYKTGGAVSRLIITDDNVLAASADNFLYSVSLDTGDIEWKRRLPGRISSLNLLGRNKVGVTVVGEKSAYIIDATDGRFLDQLVLNADEEFAGFPLVGDERFVAVATNRGITGFGVDCRNEKAAVKPAASKKLFH